MDDEYHELFLKECEEVRRLTRQRDELLEALGEVVGLLETVRGDINPERGYADELEERVFSGIRRIHALTDKVENEK